MISRIAALCTAGFLIWGGLLFADWLRARDLVSAATPAEKPNAEAPRERATDIRMDAYLPGDVAFGPVRREPFGRDFALFCSGQSQHGPERVFGAILERMQRGVTHRTIEQAMRQGPSAIAALRLQAHVSHTPGGAALVRLAPTMEGDRLRLEPGGIVLAYDGSTHWEYVVYYFPRGLDFSAFVESFAPPADVLAPLGPRAGEWLTPTLALGGGAGRPQTILCRARGEAGAAVRNTAAGLQSRGWTQVHETESASVLRGPAGEIWIATDQAEVAGGMVTIMIGAS